MRPEAPGPHRRRGPRPLLFHLMQASLKQAPPNDARPGAPTMPAGLADWAAHPPADFAPDAALLAGIAAYRAHP